MAIDQNILVTVDSIVLGKGEQDSVLLIQRKNDPFKGQWAFPGGFVEDDEDLPQAAARELEEETGLKINPQEMEQLGAWGTPGRDPRGRTVTIVFFIKASMNEHKITAADDADDAQWWPLKSLPPMAFDHKMILENIMRKIEAGQGV